MSKEALNVNKDEKPGTSGRSANDDLGSNESETYSQYLRTIEAINKKKHRPEDWRDESIHPSYSKFEVPYHMKCRVRYHEAKKMYEQQFQREIGLLMDNQSSAYEAARLNRHLCITTLWPPLHNRAEIEHTSRYFFRLNKKQRKRLNIIMSSKII